MEENEPLDVWNLSLKQVWDRSVSSPPVLTGGTILITSATLGLSLVLMPLKLSRSKSKDPLFKELLKLKISELEVLKSYLTGALKKDQKIFNSVRRAKNDSASAEQDELNREVLRQATDSTLQVAQLIVGIIELASQSLKDCRKELLSDFGAGLQLLSASLKGILLLALSNIKSMPEEERSQLLNLRAKLLTEGERKVREIIDILEENYKMIRT